MAEQRLAGTLPHEMATASWGAALAGVLQAGDLVFLTGEMGVGKTALARAIIRALTHADAHVPSPTFTLITPYEEARKPLWHADLFRLNAPEELYELGLIEARDDHIVLVEWPDKAEGLLGQANVHIHLQHHGDGRQFELSCAASEIGRFNGVYARHLTRMSFLLEHYPTPSQATLAPITGDASARAYFRIEDAGQSHILMDWPQGPDGPPIHQGKSYSQIVHLAEKADDFIQMVRWLRQNGFSAPQLKAHDLEAGLLLLEDLGNVTCVDLLGQPAHAHFYFEAIAVLAALHELPAAPQLAVYDSSVLTFETELFLDWYLPAHGISVSDDARAAWRTIWADLCADCLRLPAVTVLRDYHSPNLLWLAERQTHHRIGLIDVQDALAGSPAYDLASLLLDARIDVEDTIFNRSFQHYISQRFGQDEQHAQQFELEFWMLGLQRNLKIAGIFHRLAERDGKPAYLNHMPRIEGYLRQSLYANPALAPLVAWLQHYAPGLAWVD